MAPQPESPLAKLRRLEAEAAAKQRQTSSKGHQDRARRSTGRPDAERKSQRGPIGTVLGAIALVVVSAKGLLVLLATKAGAILSALKLGKLLATFSTMWVTAWFYAQEYGWRFAVGFVGLILVHELGHGFAARRLGLRVGAPIFIPGFGAVIALKDQPRSTWIHFQIGYGGPLFGTLGGLTVLGLGALHGDPAIVGLTRGLANITFLLNLFNLLPVAGLDGDRISEPLQLPWWIACMVTTLGATLASIAIRSGDSERSHPQVVFGMLIVVFSAIKVVSKHRRSKVARSGERLVDRVTARPGYVEEAAVEPRQRIAAALAYAVLVAFLIIAFAVTDLPRS